MKRILSCLLVITLFISMLAVFSVGASATDSTAEVDVWDGTSVSTSLSGTGTSGDPYLVQSAADLAYIAQKVNAGTHEWNAGDFYNKYFKMTCNIDLNNKEWTPIGYNCANAMTSYSFNGHFDGDGHVIYNLVIGSNNNQYLCAALFGAVFAGSVKNLGIESGNVYSNTSNGYAAGIVAFSRVGVTIDNCYNKANIEKTFSGSASKLAGILAFNGSHTAVISNCINYGTIDGEIIGTGTWNSGNDARGGIVGYAAANQNGKVQISNCYNLGDILGHTSSPSGGILGYSVGTAAANAATLTNCYSSGVVTSDGVANSGYLFGNVGCAATCSGNVAYTVGHPVDNSVKAIVGTGYTANASGTINATDELVVPTATIFDDFLLATTYGATLGVVESYTDISAYRGDTNTAPEKAGFVFAGWYTDARCAVPVDKAVKNGAAYAKFVDAEVLSVKYQITDGTTAESASTGLRLLTSVESLNLAKVSFKITFAGSTVERFDRNVYKSITGGAVTYGAYAFSGASEYFATYTMAEVPQAAFDTAFTVVPVWTTQDGTIVEGISSSIVISQNF